MRQKKCKGMEKLWAPWREEYVAGKREKGCFFCRMLKQGKGKDRKNHLIERTEFCFSVLNAFPYNNGHLMIVPKEHKMDFSRLTDKEILAMFALLRKSIRLLDRVINPHGYNIGFNIGDVAGAGVPGHIHLHLVPRWQGDTNFMPVLAGTKVISQSLDVLYDKLKKAGTSAKKRKTGKRGA